MIEKIKDAVNAKKLTGISDVIDLTDRKNGLKLVIELKSGFNPQVWLASCTRPHAGGVFGINNVALVEGQPRTLGLRELLRSTWATAGRGAPADGAPPGEEDGPPALVEGLLLASWTSTSHPDHPHLG